MEAFGTILSDGLNMIISKLPDFINAGMQLLGAFGQGILDNLPTIVDAAVQIVVMLELRGITKVYSVGGAKQKVLRNININFRNQDIIYWRILDYR